MVSFALFFLTNSEVTPWPMVSWLTLSGGALFSTI